MYVIQARNVNDALISALDYLKAVGLKTDSRNGSVVRAPVPVVTVYQKPWERVLFNPLRDANPYFHFMEALWMLAGRRDVHFPTQFNSQFGQFSDDGKVFHGAYGYRWRKWFSYDQLQIIAEELRVNPSSRRCVLAMWDASQVVENEFVGGGTDIPGDLLTAVNGGKDVPCNTHVYFDIVEGKLNITVCCRSNDIIWGAYGSNVVHFSMLQELMASWVGCQIGTYYQLSNNFHIYTDKFPEDKWLEMCAASVDYYNISNQEELKGIPPFRMVNVPIDHWLTELEFFIANPNDNFKEPFFEKVAKPMYRSYMVRKGKLGTGYAEAGAIRAEDWRLACQQWIQRREAKKNA